MNLQTDNFEDIFKSAKTESLTQSERVSMRNSIQLFMSEHPLQASFALRVKNGALAVLRAFDPAAPRARFVPATLALVMVIGIGTSYAAETALPGDVLYPVKIYINESIQGSLAVSQASKAEWNTQLMTRRLEEAEMLTSQDRLTPIARTDIQAQLLKSANDFDKNVAALAQTSDGASAIATAQSNLEASLVGHVQVLAELTADVPEVQDTSDEVTPTPAAVAVAPIAAIAQAQVDDSRTARISAEAIVASSTSPEVAPVAFAAKAMATKAITSVQDNVAASMSDESTDTVPVHTAARAAFRAEQTVADGNEKLDRGEYAKAFTIFQAAIRAARAAQVHLDASQRLDTGTTSDTPEDLSK